MNLLFFSPETFTFFSLSFVIFAQIQILKTFLCAIHPQPIRCLIPEWQFGHTDFKLALHFLKAQLLHRSALPFFFAVLLFEKVTFLWQSDFEKNENAKTWIKTCSGHICAKVCRRWFDGNLSKKNTQG